MKVHTHLIVKEWEDLLPHRYTEQNRLLSIFSFRDKVRNPFCELRSEYNYTVTVFYHLGGSQTRGLTNGTYLRRGNVTCTLYLFSFYKQ